MKRLKHIIAGWLAIHLSLGPLIAQPILTQPNPFQSQTGTGINNLRVVQQSPDGTEVVLTMEYTYDGFGGQNALIVPVIEKRDQKGIAAWFGADPVTVGMGKGLVSIKVKYFNDEPGVPLQLTSDRLRILLLNRTGTAIISSIPFLKTIKWGNPNIKPQPLAVTPSIVITEDRTDRELARQKAEAETKIREESHAQAEAEAKVRRAAEEKARADAAARESARLKAEGEARRLAEEKRVAEEKARTEAKIREEARLKVEAETKRLAEERRAAEAKARVEAAARETARLKAEAEEKARLEAETKAKADALAREAARLKAESEAKRLAEENRLAQDKAQREAKAREEARVKAEADAKSLAEEKRVADERAEMETAAREKARLAAEAEAKRLAEEKRMADEKAKGETEARRLAEEKARQEAEAKAKAEAEVRRLAVQPSVPPSSSARSQALEPLASGLKSKITNVDVVNRSLDRTRMTIGVEYEYKDNLGSKPMLGVEVTKTDEPTASHYFQSQPAEIGKSRRNFLLFPIKFQPPGSVVGLNSYTTDQVLVYLLEPTSSKRFNLFPTTMLLLWRPPGTVLSTPMADSGSTLELDDFKQNDPHTGYVTVRYSLLSGPGKLRMRLFDAAKPASAQWFSVPIKTVKAGRGLQVLDISVEPDAKAPTDIFRIDTIEIELLDSGGQVAAKINKKSPMNWAKPE
jgi:membrane protein involved in colicin uptake